MVLSWTRSTDLVHVFPPSCQSPERGVRHGAGTFNVNEADMMSSNVPLGQGLAGLPLPRANARLARLPCTF